MNATQPIRASRVRQHRSARFRAVRRRGSATVELAICLPVLLTAALGMIETCNAVFLQGRLQSAAFESCRVAVRPTTAENAAATASTVQSDAQTLCTQLGINSPTITISPSSLASLAPQTLVTVTISAPFNKNSVTMYVLPSSLTLTASATMIVE